MLKVLGKYAVNSPTTSATVFFQRRCISSFSRIPMLSSTSSAQGKYITVSKVPETSTTLFSQRRCVSIIPKIPTIKFYSLRKKFAEMTSNKFKPERVAVLGPDLACLEWLMECGSSSVLMSDGTEITRIKQMREFIKSYGFDVKNLPKLEKRIEPFNEKLIKNENLYAQKWRNTPQIFIKEVDASDSAISDEGFNYFLECKMLRKLRLNHCDYFTDTALRILSTGRSSKSLQDLEICLNPWLSDGMAYWVVRLKELKRAHFYFLPYVANRPATLRQMKMGLPRAKITFPETDKIGYGYDSKE